MYGDSHSAALRGAVDGAARVAQRAGLLFARSVCPPIIGELPVSMSVSRRVACQERNAEALDFILRSPQLDTVILSAYWNVYPYVDTLRAAILSVTNRLVGGGKFVIILNDIPYFEDDVPATLAWEAQRGLPFESREKQFSPELQRFFDCLGRIDGVRVISLRPAFCDHSGCRTQVDGHSLFTDDNHVSAYAARQLIAPYLIDHGLFGSVRSLGAAVRSYDRLLGACNSLPSKE